MTLSQMLMIGKRATLGMQARLCDEPSLEEGTWIIRFMLDKKQIVLQVSFPDCETENGNDLYKIERRLAQKMRAAILFQVELYG